MVLVEVRGWKKFSFFLTQKSPKSMMLIFIRDVEVSTILLKFWYNRCWVAELVEVKFLKEIIILISFVLKQKVLC